MAGFDNDVLVAQNVNFDPTSLLGPAQPPFLGQVTANGQLLIGSAAAPFLRANTLTQGAGISITNGPGTITIGLSGGGAGIDSIAVQTGTSPVVPDGTGLVTINGAVVAAGTNPIRTNGTGPNTLAMQVQTSQALAAGDATKIGLANFSSAQFAVSAAGFVTSLGSMTDYHVARYIVSAGGATDGANYTTIALAYAAAVAAGAPQTVFVQPGTYTENITLTPGINIAAFDCDALTPNVSIVGKLTLSAAGSVTISGIRHTTNGDFALAVTGSAASILNLKNCYINCSNNTGVSHTSSDGGSFIFFYNCRGDILTTGISIFSSTSAGRIVHYQSVFFNTGNSLTPSSSSSNVTMSHCNFLSSFSVSSTGFFQLSHVAIDVDGFNIPAITTAGSGTSIIVNCDFSTGSGSSISVGVGSTVHFANSSIKTSNTNAITGAGTIFFGDVAYRGSSSLINTTSQQCLVTQKGSYKVALPAGDYTVLTSDEIVGATSSAARAITLNTTPTLGQVVTIKDVTGTAAANNITITPAAGTIDGAATKVINTNYGSVTLFYSGAAWFII
jgi:hypothetical protein